MKTGGIGNTASGDLSLAEILRGKTARDNAGPEAATTASAVTDGAGIAGRSGLMERNFSGTGINQPEYVKANLAGLKAESNTIAKQMEAMVGLLQASVMPDNPHSEFNAYVAAARLAAKSREAAERHKAEQVLEKSEKQREDSIRITEEKAREAVLPEELLATLPDAGNGAVAGPAETGEVVAQVAESMNPGQNYQSVVQNPTDIDIIV